MQMAVRLSMKGRDRDFGVYQETSKGLPCIEGRPDCRGAVAGVPGSCRGIGMIDMPPYPSCSSSIFLMWRQYDLYYGVVLVLVLVEVEVL